MNKNEEIEANQELAEAEAPNDNDDLSDCSKEKPAVKKTRRKKKWKKPKDKPKRPLSAYNIFFREERSKILSQNYKRVSFESLAQQIARKWKSLDPESRKTYEIPAQIEQMRYKKELDDWAKSKSPSIASQCTSDPSLPINYTSQNQTNGVRDPCNIISMHQQLPSALNNIMKTNVMNDYYSKALQTENFISNHLARQLGNPTADLARQLGNPTAESRLRMSIQQQKEMQMINELRRIQQQRSFSMAQSSQFLHQTGIGQKYIEPSLQLSSLMQPTNKVNNHIHLAQQQNLVSLNEIKLMNELKKMQQDKTKAEIEVMQLRRHINDMKDSENYQLPSAQARRVECTNRPALQYLQNHSEKIVRNTSNLNLPISTPAGGIPTRINRHSSLPSTITPDLEKGFEMQRKSMMSKAKKHSILKSASKRSVTRKRKIIDKLHHIEKITPVATEINCRELTTLTNPSH